MTLDVFDIIGEIVKFGDLDMALEKDDRLIKSGEVMHLLNISRETVRLWALSGELRVVRQSKGGTRFFSLREIEALARGRTADAD